MPGQWFKKRLKDARLRLGFTQKELGTELGVKGPTICLWELGTVKPGRETRERVEAWLNAKENGRQGGVRKKAQHGRNNSQTGESQKLARSQGSHKVFVVHGQDDAAKLAVKEFLQKLDLKGVVLHEQPNKGQTIIEKFESHEDVDFVLVLLTPDDIGGPGATSPEKLKPRARQNVVFELGYFLGKLGRLHVCALHKGEVELPSDFGGMSWVEMDKAGGWMFTVAREMRERGIPIDLNLLA